MEGLIVLVIFGILFLGIVKSLSSANKTQQRKSQKGFEDKSKYIVEHEEELARKRAKLVEDTEKIKLQERRKKREHDLAAEKRREKELAYIKETLDKCRKNPDINIAIYNDEAWQIHWDRLNTFGRSMYSGEMYYRGSKGGIYTLSANGTRYYKY